MFFSRLLPLLFVKFFCSFAVLFVFFLLSLSSLFHIFVPLLFLSFRVFFLLSFSPFSVIVLLLSLSFSCSFWVLFLSFLCSSPVLFLSSSCLFPKRPHKDSRRKRREKKKHSKTSPGEGRHQKNPRRKDYIKRIPGGEKWPQEHLLLLLFLFGVPGGEKSPEKDPRRRKVTPKGSQQGTNKRKPGAQGEKNNTKRTLGGEIWDENKGCAWRVDAREGRRCMQTIIGPMRFQKNWEKTIKRKRKRKRTWKWKGREEKNRDTTRKSIFFWPAKRHTASTIAQMICNIVKYCAHLSLSLSLSLSMAFRCRCFNRAIKHLRQCHISFATSIQFQKQ